MWCTKISNALLGPSRELNDAVPASVAPRSCGAENKKKDAQSRRANSGPAAACVRKDHDPVHRKQSGWVFGGHNRGRITAHSWHHSASCPDCPTASVFSSAQPPIKLAHRARELPWSTPFRGFRPSLDRYGAGATWPSAAVLHRSVNDFGEYRGFVRRYRSSATVVVLSQP